MRAGAVGQILQLSPDRDDNESVNTARVFPQTLLRFMSRELPGCQAISATPGLLQTIVRSYDIPVELGKGSLQVPRGETTPMHEHGPNELIGPVRGTSAWWQGMGGQPESSAEGPPEPKKTRKKRRSTDTPIRQELVERVRREIAAGAYDTPEKWDAALDCLLDRLEKDA